MNFVEPTAVVGVIRLLRLASLYDFHELLELESRIGVQLAPLYDRRYTVGVLAYLKADLRVSLSCTGLDS